MNESNGRSGVPEMATPRDDLPVKYVRAGFALIPIPLGVKGPLTRGWQLEENAIRTEEQAARLNGGNIGLAHRWCGTCAVDIDAYQTALPWLEQHGIDLQSLLLAYDACSSYQRKAEPRQVALPPAGRCKVAADA